MTEEIPPLKVTVQTAVPHAWRATLSAIVDSLLRGDARIGQNLENVDPLAEDRSALCRELIEAYGSPTLIPLPDATWRTSIASWQGNRWDCLIDLWSAEDGSTDLVLDIAVFEDDETAFRFRPHLVYVA
ncbi:DUF7668 domain-containing protein [Kribbella ginsengisoli]|uniref:DUF7668 domain-containing protein n=1 Tax=Kribbella ginsengisoli TaxID=363865 RepID=A0ABP6XJ71_9ACTN